MPNKIYEFDFYTFDIRVMSWGEVQGKLNKRQEDGWEIINMIPNGSVNLWVSFRKECNDNQS